MSSLKDRLDLRWGAMLVERTYTHPEEFRGQTYHCPSLEDLEARALTMGDVSSCGRRFLGALPRAMK